MRLNSSLRGALAIALLAVCSIGAHAAERASLAVVKAVRPCADLARTDLSRVADTPGTVTAAETVDTEQGPFCRVTVKVEPLIILTINLPTERWTQRYIQYGGGGGAPGPNGYDRAGTCQPALNGEFAVGGNNLGHFVAGEPQGFDTVQGWEWAKDPQRRIDYAYRASHVNVLVARALMQAYYGRAPRYAYFMGCSEGGREALIEAQRYPGDFDGVSAGAPAALQAAQETTFHLWIAQSNRRMDGTNILMPEKRKLIHDAVLAQCDTLSGVKDGLLQDPSACHFSPASLRCPAAATDTARCLTDEEVGALQRLYDGAHDGQGNALHFGLQRGGEALWGLANTPMAAAPGARQAALSMAYLMLPEVTPAAVDYDHMVFSRAAFALGATLSPLYDGANTDLKPFAARGGKLILWHGLSDFQIPPGATLAYYRGLQQFMGVAVADRFVRMFLIPGMGHCGGGDGYDQFDVLTPLMAWTESKQAPTQIMTGRLTERRTGNGNAPGQPARPPKPFATSMPKLSATRPAYPFPAIPHYTGKGDPDDGANYERGTSPEAPARDFDNEAARLFGPDNQKNYGVKGGKLVVLGLAGSRAGGFPPTHP
jgi:feruloyl esterase